MRSLVIVSMLMLSLIGFGCAKQLPLVLNYEQEPIPARIDTKPYSMEEVQRAILSACRNKGWSASMNEQGKIDASITVRSKHRAKIKITYTTTQYSIQYVDSSGLKYNDGYIHSNYNHWIAKLDAEIKKEFGLKTQRF